MFERITSNPAILSGKPCIRGTRISVAFILELIASGASASDIVSVYPHLTVLDVEEAVRFASYTMEHDIFMTVNLRDSNAGVSA